MQTTPQKVVNFSVQNDRGKWAVFEQGFEKSIAEFEELEKAEQYAFRLAEIKANWKIDVFDETRRLIATYNSEDDSMPKPIV